MTAAPDGPGGQACPRTGTGGVVVFAIGNDARGDDALGPLLAQALEAIATPGVVVLAEYQLQVEHALDLRDAALVLFIDAAESGPSPYALCELQPEPATPALTHALSPEALLAVYARVEGRPPPPAFLLAVRGEAFELGAALSTAARRHFDAAWRLLASLPWQEPVSAWRGAVAQAGATE